MTTKNKIKREAIKLFNKNGYAAISLFELAQQLDMSRGNLTYHFKNKDLLLEAIAQEMWMEIESMRSKSRLLPSFENLHNGVQLLYKIQKEYSFIYLDTHVLQHAKIKNQFRKMAKQGIRDNEAAIAFAISLGNMKPEPVPGIYHNVAFMSWMVPFYWLSQQIILGEKSNEEAEKMIWSMLVPHFTVKGVRSFKKFFGAKYYKQLGQPFTNNIESYINI